jgi:hypothetical protein
MTSEAYTVAEVENLGDAHSHCGNCDWKGRASETGNIGKCCLTPGDTSPVGRCPICGSLAYVDDRPVRIVIGLDGGVIQGVTANVPVVYLVYDYDVEGCETNEVALRPALDGGQVEVYNAGSYSADVNAEIIETIYKAIDAVGEGNGDD